MKNHRSKKVDRSIDERLLEWVENHRIVIGMVLVVVIVAGAIVLSVVNAKPQVVEKPTVDPAVEEELTALREQNTLLRKQIEQVNQARVAGKSSSKAASSAVAKEKSNQKQSGLININTADQKSLESLPKIGPAIASRIIDYRNVNGSFKSIEEIKNVKGIGDKTFEQIRDLITVE